MPPQMDDSIEKLQEFCGALTAANDQLAQGTPALQAQAERAEQIGGDVEEHLGGLNDVLQDFEQELDQAEQAAADQLDKLADVAQEIAQSRLDGAEQRAEAAQADLERSALEDHTELEKGFAELSDGAFEPLGETLDSLQAETARMQTEGEADFDALQAGLEAAQEAIEGERSPTTDALQQAEDDVEQDGQEMETEGAALAADMTTVSDDLEAHCAETGEALEQAYDEWSEDVQEEEKQLTEGLQAMAGEAAALVEDEHAEALAQAVSETLDNSLGALQQQLDQAIDAAGGGDQTTTELEPLLAQLDIAQRKAEEIDRAIDSVDGQ